MFDRFLREARNWRGSSITPEVMHVYGGDKRTKVYMVMEWCEGRLLRQILDEGLIPQERAIRITIGILDALEYIHSKGVAHRDLKPENIMVDEQRQHQADRLWDRKRLSRPAADLRQLHRDAGHGQLHLPGAGEGQTWRRAHGHLRDGRNTLRNADGEAAVCRPHPDGRHE